MMHFAFGIENAFNEKMRFQTDLVFNSPEREVYGVFDNGKLLSEYLLIDYKMRLRNSIVSMGGIGNLCTSSIYRGMGAVKFMLSKSLKTMKDNGNVVSVLYPFDEPFYRKYGWERFDSMKKFVISPGIIKVPKNEEKIDLEETSVFDKEIQNFYNSYASNHYSMTLKDEVECKFDSVLWIKEDVCRNLVKFYRNGKMTGLLRYIYLNKNYFKNETEFTVNIFITEDLKTKYAMLNFLRKLSQQINEIELLLPEDFVIWPYLSSKPKEERIINRSMIRIVDLLSLDLEVNSEDLSIIIKVEDKQVEWNNGTFILSIKDKKLSFKKTDKNPELSCSISTLSSIVGGYTNFEEMIEAGKVIVLKEWKGKDISKNTNLVLQHF